MNYYVKFPYFKMVTQILKVGKQNEPTAPTVNSALNVYVYLRARLSLFLLRSNMKQAGKLAACLQILTLDLLAV